MRTQVLDAVRIHDLLEVDARAVRSAPGAGGDPGHSSPPYEGGVPGGSGQGHCGVRALFSGAAASYVDPPEPPFRKGGAKDARPLLVEGGTNDAQPAWVRERLCAVPFVVVRRGAVTPGALPVGVRGECRHERWAGWVAPEAVITVITPADLLDDWGGRHAKRACDTKRPRDAALPALECLEIVRRRWRDCGYPWGPAGSVGFELATGTPAVSPASDLDLVMYADEPMPLPAARFLFDAIADLPVRMDIRVETPSCGFSLAEFVKEYPGKILLRTARGPMLGSDPWK
jgi:phosphoribosyl-dephospho-CoA transferase